MNPYKVLKGTLKTLTVAAPLAMFAGAEGCFWGLRAFAGNDAQKKFDDFTQTEIFQAVKAEEEAGLNEIKNQMDDLQLQYSKGEISAKTYLDAKAEFDQQYSQQYEFVNGDGIVVSTMKKYDKGIYEDYRKVHTLAECMTATGVIYSAFAPIITIGWMTLINGSDKINSLFFDQIQLYDEKKKGKCAAGQEKSKTDEFTK